MLDSKLEAYAKSDYYPFHMPGHKRTPLDMSNPYSIDITEIDGFDNLHAAEGILKEAQQRAADLYGAEESFYLVNGSTCGILAGISAAVKAHGTLLMARNVHKSVYHAVYLRGLMTEYLNPAVTEFGIQGAIDPQEVEKKLKNNPDIKAVVITSPTYEGVVSDVKAIAKIVHQYNIPLIVDEAHGAHFGFHEAFPQTAVRLGADIVIQSMHKVLPSLTQTALLHIQSEYVSKEDVKKYLNIYETSSPSYVLMAGMEKCIRMLKEDGKSLFHQYVKLLMDFYKKAEDFRYIHIMKSRDFLDAEVFDLDISKIVISVKDTSFTARELNQRLLEKYHLQMEMMSSFYVLAMTSIMDTKEGFDRLYEALKEIDEHITFEEMKEYDAYRFVKEFYTPREKRLELHQAMDLPTENVSFEEAIGKISGNFVYLYPPGVPVLLPGERIDEMCIKNIRKALKFRLNLQGIADIINERIEVVNF